ncbi:MAG: response regulator [Pseudolabrys sp.]|nr:response regulator [Pseudolabrys sp.]
MTSSTTQPPRLLVVEDEYLIRMLLEDMIADLGYEVSASVGTLADATEQASSGTFDAAILDVNVEGQEVFPAAEILAQRNVPFIFVTGYGEGGLPPAYRGRPTLQKPFQADQLRDALAGLLAGSPQAA